jgi:hypothetical protein
MGQGIAWLILLTLLPPDETHLVVPVPEGAPLLLGVERLDWLYLGVPEIGMDGR